jgi:hypothetical protein
MATIAVVAAMLAQAACASGRATPARRRTQQTLMRWWFKSPQ